MFITRITWVIHFSLCPLISTSELFAECLSARQLICNVHMNCICIYMYIFIYVSVTLNNYVDRNDKGHTPVLYLRGLLEPKSTLLLAYPLRGIHIVALAVAWWTFQHTARDLWSSDCISAAFTSSSDVGTARTVTNDLLSRAQESHSYSTYIHTYIHLPETTCNHQQILQRWLQELDN